MGNGDIGVHAMTVTPFDGAGAIDEELFRSHVQFLATHGVGIYVASQGSGEGDLLSFDEKVTLYRRAVEEGRGRERGAASVGVGVCGGGGLR